MEVIVSKNTRSKIRQMAKQTGRTVEEMAGSLLDEKITEIKIEKPKRRTLADLKGMFDGGPGDTAARAPEILRAEMGLNSVGGED